VPVSQYENFVEYITKRLSNGLFDGSVMNVGDVISSASTLAPFRALHIRSRARIVNDGLCDGEIDMNDCGNLLTPADWHEELSQRGAFVVDCRNYFESDIGRFDDARALDVDFFREVFPAIRKMCEREATTNTKIYLYCTGGIRCMKVGAYLKKLGYADVNSLDGGINAYASYISKLKAGVPNNGPAVLSGATEGNRGPIKSLFKGKNFVFDSRSVMAAFWVISRIIHIVILFLYSQQVEPRYCSKNNRRCFGSLCAV
jgi:predicted sulfurtransferase